jgi:hypothetical protein
VTRGAIALASGLALGALVIAPSAAHACDVCNLKLTHRTGPYRIVVTKEGPPVAKKAPQLRVVIINPGPRPLVLGDTPTSRVVLNGIAPNARAMFPLSVAARGHTKTVAPRSRVVLYARTQFPLNRPGVYRFNVSYGPVDSNIVTYTVTTRP